MGYNIIDTINYIEANLREPLTLKQLADHAGYSPYHFHRIFYAICGENIKDYIRKRRLSAASLELLQSRKRVIEIAFRYRFTTPEGFARAFKRQFNANPLSYRRGEIRFCALERQPFTPEQLTRINYGGVMDVTFCEKEAIVIMGYSEEVPNHNEMKQICPRLWGNIMQRMGEIPASTEGVAIGITEAIGEIDLNTVIESADMEMAAQSYQYYAGFPVAEAENLPEGMVQFTAPGGLYAIFTHKGGMERLKDSFDYIYGVWFPKSGYRLREQFDLEYYDHRFKPGENDSEMEIWIPVQKPAE